MLPSARTEGPLPIDYAVRQVLTVTWTLAMSLVYMAGLNEKEMYCVKTGAHQIRLVAEARLKGMIPASQGSNNQSRSRDPASDTSSWHQSTHPEQRDETSHMHHSRILVTEIPAHCSWAPSTLSLWSNRGMMCQPSSLDMIVKVAPAIRGMWQVMCIWLGPCTSMIMTFATWTC